MSKHWQQGLAVLGVLVAIHLILALLPGPTLSPAINIALLATNLYVAYSAWGLLADRSGRSLALFSIGYGLLFVLLMVVLDRQPLFILLVVVYASVYRSSFLLGIFALFVLCFVVLQPYAAESFVLLLAIYLILWRVKHTSLFVKLCLGLGLTILAAVMFPLVYLMFADSAQTLLATARRPDVQEAVLLSLATATVATFFVALWGIPLGYALARSHFVGKRWVEAVIDVPILVPQSVAGIALMVLLGPGSPVGSALADNFGLTISGRFIGIVIAQVFVASPFVIKTAMTACEAVPLPLEMASRTLGAGAAQTFWRITLPLATRGIFVGMILAWARAISEFGSIILFAATPLTAPVLVHTEFLRAGITESRPIAVLLLMTCLWIFILLQFSPSLLPVALRRPAREEPT